MNYKIIIGVVLFFLSVLIGCEYVKKYIKKRVFFTEFNNFNDILIGEISYMKNTIPEIVKKNFIDKSDFYKGLYMTFIKGDKDVLYPNYLTDKETNLYINYIKTIGRGNSIATSQYLNSVKNTISLYLNESIKMEEKNKPLCIKLSIIIGLIAIIALL